MIDTRFAEATGIAAGGDEAARYDSLTMTLRWITAILVVNVFSLAHIWSFFPHDGPTQITMQTAHVSFGVILAIVLMTRLLWRSVRGRRLPPAASGLDEVAARAMHFLLSARLCAF